MICDQSSYLSVDYKKNSITYNELIIFTKKIAHIKKWIYTRDATSKTYCNMAITAKTMKIKTRARINGNGSRICPS